MRKNNNFEEILLGRKSVRQFDTSVKISKEEMEQIISEAVTAPSAINMQPWRFVVIESEAGKETLKPLIRFNTRQNDTSSAMILVLGDLQNFDYAERIYSEAVEKGVMPQEVKEAQLGAFTPMYSTLTKEDMAKIVTIDGSLAAMQLMLVARSYGYETNPMTGFEHDKIVEAFGFDPERYVPIMMIAIGKAEEEGYPSIRMSTDEVVTFK